MAAAAAAGPEALKKDAVLSAVLEIYGTPFGAARAPMDVRLLGEGGYGAAFKAGNFVVKLMALRHSGYLKAFQEEVRIWTDLDGKPALSDYIPEYQGHYIVKNSKRVGITYLTAEEVKAHTFETDGPLIGALLQTYEPVQSLRSILDEARITRSIPILQEQNAVKFMEQLMNAYTQLHKAGYLHKDIKPENILVREEMDKRAFPIIIDMGLACKIPCTETHWAGTRGYVPENYAGINRRLPARTYKVVKKPMNMTRAIKRGLKTLLGMRRIHPILPTKSAVRVREGAVVAPAYSIETDNYAIGVTLQEIIKRVNWRHAELKQQYESIANYYIFSAAAFVAAQKAKVRAGWRGAAAAALNARLPGAAAAGVELQPVRKRSGSQSGSRRGSRSKSKGKSKSASESSNSGFGSP